MIGLRSKEDRLAALESDHPTVLKVKTLGNLIVQSWLSGKVRTRSIDFLWNCRAAGYRSYNRALQQLECFAVDERRLALAEAGLSVSREDLQVARISGILWADRAVNERFDRFDAVAAEIVQAYLDGHTWELRVAGYCAKDAIKESLNSWMSS